MVEDAAKKRRPRLFGFPVVVDQESLAISALFLLVFVMGGFEIADAALFVAAVLPVVVVHELGHAFESRRVGGNPTIGLGLLGGHTAGMPPEASHWRRTWISLAGITYSLVFLALLAGGSFLFGGQLDGWMERWLSLTVLINGVWAGVQLLPIGNFDGTSALAHSMEAMRVMRPRQIVLALQVASGVVVVAWLLTIEAWFIAAYAVYLSWRGIAASLEQVRWEADRAKGWDDDIAKIDKRDLNLLVETVSEIRAEARSKVYRRWSAELHVEGLLAAKDVDTLEEVLPAYETELDVELVSRLWLAIHPDRCLQFLEGRRMSLDEHSLGNKPQLLKTLLLALAVTGERGALWAVARRAGARKLRPAGFNDVAVAAAVNSADDILGWLMDDPPDGDKLTDAFEAAKFRILTSTEQDAAPVLDALVDSRSAFEAQSLAVVLALAKRKAALIEAGERSSTTPFGRLAIQFALHLMGHYRDAMIVGRRTLENELDQDQQNQACYNLACSLARLGQHDLAMRSLSEVTDPRLLRQVGSDDDLASLRSDPRFEEVMSDEASK